MWISPVPLMWVARVTCATLYVLGNWNATWCVLPCKGQQNSSKTLSSLCLCSSTSLAFSLLTQVTIFFYYLFPGAVPVTHFFYSFFHYLFPGTLQVTFFFTVFLQINYFMVSRGWLKSPFTILLHPFTQKIQQSIIVSGAFGKRFKRIWPGPARICRLSKAFARCASCVARQKSGTWKLLFGHGIQTWNILEHLGTSWNILEQSNKWHQMTISSIETSAKHLFCAPLSTNLPWRWRMNCFTILQSMSTSTSSANATKPCTIVSWNKSKRLARSEDRAK